MGTLRSRSLVLVHKVWEEEGETRNESQRVTVRQRNIDNDVNPVERMKTRV